MQQKCHSDYRCKFCGKNHDAKECIEKFKEKSRSYLIVVTVARIIMLIHVFVRRDLKKITTNMKISQ